ncbi:MAG: DUF1223 domain-containing protein, partial [Verrucomicrobiota bacterium]
SVLAAPLVLESAPQRVSLIELYTSEGCSSCPPAEAWFSKLKNEAGLWKNFVPVSFHVTYWDYIGWKDRFGSKKYDARQNSYAAAWHSSTVYTPEFVQNGKELKERKVPSASKTSVGVLKATLDEKRALTVSFQPNASGKKYEVYAVLLGGDLESSVKAGENSGRKLRHDFVALSFQSEKLNSEGEGKLTLPAALAGEKGLAVWVTEANDLQPVQAVGGWLK